MITAKAVYQRSRKTILLVLGVTILALLTISILRTLVFTNERTRGWDHYTMDNSNLASEFADLVEIDASGRAWISTSEGVSVFDGESWQNFALPDYIRGMAVDPSGHVWFVSDTSIYRYDGGELAPPVRTDFVTAEGWMRKPIAIDSSGKVWVGTINGVEVFNGPTKITLGVDNSGLISNHITAIALDRSGRAWIGTSKGISVYDGETWLTYDTSNSAITGDHITDIVFDPLGHAWIGTYENGVSVFNGEDWETHLRYEQRYGPVDGIVIGPNGNVLVLSNCLTIFNGTSWTTYDVWNSGLANASGSDIAVDPTGRVWIPSFYGIMAANLDDQGFPAGVSDESLANMERSIFNWRFMLAPIAVLVVLWMAICLDDIVLFLMSLVAGVFWILVTYFGVLSIHDLDLFYIVAAASGGGIGGIISSLIWKLIKKDRASVLATLVGTLIGAFMGFAAGLMFLFVLVMI